MRGRAAASTRAACAVVLAASVACSSNDAAPAARPAPTVRSAEAIAQVVTTTTVASSTTTTLAPPSGPPVDLGSLDVCAVVDAAAVSRLIGATEGTPVVAEPSTTALEPFGAIDRCDWSAPGTSRGLNLAVTAAGRDLDDLLGLGLLTDATLGFDRRPVPLGEEALVQVVDSSSQGVSRVCVAARDRGALWLACLEDAGDRFTLDHPAVTDLVDVLAVSFAAL